MKKYKTFKINPQDKPNIEKQKQTIEIEIYRQLTRQPKPLTGR